MSETLDNLGDKELLRRMLAGETSAFVCLYERWQTTVYRFSLRMSGSEALAEDVTQDVFLSLMRAGGQFAGRGSFAAYLLTIARHSILRRLQRERRFVALDAEEESEPIEEAGADPLAALSRDEMIEAVRQAVLGLPPHYREVVVLCHLHELSYADAAEVIGCEIGTVCSRLYRARALLAKRLEAHKADSTPRKAALGSPR